MTGARLLVVSPHPDDETLGCGGTIAKLVSAGATAKVIFLTSGELGGHGAPEDETRARRESEAAAAAEILGVSGIEFWREPDGRVRATARTVDRLRREIATFRPTTIYAPHAGEMHPDHRAASRIVSKASEGTVVENLFFEVWTPLARMDHIEDISETLDTKVEAIRAHASQCAVIGFDHAFVGLARYRGEMFCWPEGDFAECFIRGRS